jgi:hypothetical protein
MQSDFDPDDRIWYVDPEKFRAIREAALEDEMHGRDTGLRYLMQFGPGTVTVIVRVHPRTGEEP